MGLFSFFLIIPVGCFAVTVWYFLASFLHREQPVFIQVLLIFAAIIIGILAAGMMSAAACFGLIGLGVFK